MTTQHGVTTEDFERWVEHLLVRRRTQKITGMPNIQGMVSVTSKTGEVTWYTKEEFATFDLGIEYHEILVEDTIEHMPMSDLMSAESIKWFFGGRITYGQQTKQWRIWDGITHRVDKEGEVGRIVQMYAYVLHAALKKVKDQCAVEAGEAADEAQIDPNIPDDTIEKARKRAFAAAMQQYTRGFAKQRAYRDLLFQNRGQKAIASQLTTSCAVNDEEFDTDPNILVFDNGVLDLDEFALSYEINLKPHDPRRMVTKRMGCAYEPSHEMWDDGLWEHYITTAMPDPEVRTYLQKVAGSALLASTDEKAFFNLIGESDSGKSVFIEMLERVFGDYAQNVAAATFLAKGTGADFNRQLLRGARVVTTSEPGKGKRMDDDLIKSITGGDKQTTEAKYQNPVSWIPQCTIFIASNSPMKFDTTDYALLKRLKPIRFGVTFLDTPDAPAERRMDKTLRRRLKDSLPLQLNWVLEGLRLYLQDGLEEPLAIANERQTIRTEIEPVLQWMDEMIAAGRVRIEEGLPGSHYTLIRDLYQDYNMQMMLNGEKPVGKQNMSAVLCSKYGAKFNSGGWRIPRIVLVPAAERNTYN